PEGLRLYDIPFPFYLDYALVWLLGRIVGPNAGYLVNGFWFLSILLTAASSFFSFRFLGLRRSLALGFALCFAFLPHVFFRGTGHVLLTLYFIPPIAAVAFIIGANRGDELLHRKRWPFFGAAFLSGFTHTYLPFIAAAVLAFSAFAMAGRHGLKKRRSVLAALIFPLLPVGGTLVAMGPTLWHWRGAPPSEHGRLQKTPAETDIYGLKLRHLFLPIPNHPVPALASLSEKMSEAGFPHENENRAARLGSLGASGLAFLFGLVYFRRSTGHRETDRVLESAALVSTMLIAFATVGGLGSFLSVFVTPEFRALNRVSPYLGFAGLYCLAALIERRLCNIRNTRVLQISSILFVTLLPVLGLFDQVAAAPIRNLRERDAALAAEVQGLLADINRKDPDTRSLLLLPHTPFMHDPGRARMGSYEHARFFIQGHNIGTSWPHLDGRKTNWSRFAAAQTPAKLVEIAALAQFDGIVVDTFGYTDGGGAILNGLSTSSSQSFLSSTSGRWKYLSLSETRAKVESSMDSKQLARRQLLATHPPFIRFGPGFYGEEQVPSVGRSFYWIKKTAHLELVNTLPVARTISFEMELRSGTWDPLPFTIDSPAGRETLSVSTREQTSFSRKFDIPADGKIEIKLTFHGGPVNAPQDPRELFAMVIHPRLVETTFGPEMSALNPNQ
ncbi:MAG: hypothetical protein ACREIA_17515, partial [Opitutaceae bacterium]